jgi:hypothetical protein
MPNLTPLSMRRAAGLIGTTLAALALAGCGVVEGNHVSGAVTLRVTSGFGAGAIASGSLGKAPSHTSVLAFTQRFAKVTTSGGQVTAIDGRSASGHQHWFLYVNGIAETTLPSASSLSSGDHVWWDLHDNRAEKTVPAIVGSYPEPFANGSGGQSYPTTVTCASGLTTACHEVTDSLDTAGIKVSFQGLGTGSGSDSLAMLVGTYTQLRGVIASELLQAGPSQSGVYAQFVVGAAGQVLELDNAQGDVADTIHGSVGLIAATEQAGLNEPVWLVTGTDAAGVAAAAKALTPAVLAGHFAVVVAPGAKVMSLPLAPGS